MTLAVGTDLLFVIVLVIFCFRGASRGFSGEAISLLATIGGFLLAWKLSSGVSSFLSGFLPMTPGAAQAAALVVIYIAILIGGVYAGRVVRAFLRFTHLSGIDRGLGIVAGAVKAYALLMILYVGLMSVSTIVSPYWMNESFVMRIAAGSWPSVQKGLSGIRILDPESLPWKSIPQDESADLEDVDPDN